MNLLYRVLLKFREIKEPYEFNFEDGNLYGGESIDVDSDNRSSTQSNDKKNISYLT